MQTPTDEWNALIARRDETIEIVTAERDAAFASVRALVAIIAKAGGYMTPEQQQAYRDAKALLGIGPTRKTWVDR